MGEVSGMPSFDPPFRNPCKLRPKAYAQLLHNPAPQSETNPESPVRLQFVDTASVL
jgi:hypothetical protein